jgi:hypothetical protein
MGAKICCADTRDNLLDININQFETFGCIDKPPVPSVLDTLNDREDIIDFINLSYNRILDTTVLRSDNEGIAPVTYFKR